MSVAQYTQRVFFEEMVLPQMKQLKSMLGRVLVKEVFQRAFTNSVDAADFDSFQLSAPYQFQNRERMQGEDLGCVFDGEDLVHLAQ